MQVPETLEGGPVHDGLTLKRGRGRCGNRVRNDGLEIGQIRAQRWERVGIVRSEGKVDCGLGA